MYHVHIRVAYMYMYLVYSTCFFQQKHEIETVLGLLSLTFDISSTVDPSPYVVWGVGRKRMYVQQFIVHAYIIYLTWQCIFLL